MKKLIFCAAILLPAPALAQTFNSGGVAAGTGVTVGGNSDSDSDSALAASPPSTVGVTVISSTGNDDDGTATAFSNVTASWASAAAGAVTFNWGWNGNTNVVTGYNTNGVENGWTYSFTTGAAASQFLVNWLLTVGGQGSAFGLQGIYGSGGLPFNVTPSGVTPTNGSGSFAVALAPNTTYTFGMNNFGNVSGPGGFSDANATATFNWRIVSAAIPEPTTWAMMILGFGVVGGAMRLARRRQRVRVAFRPA